MKEQQVPQGSAEELHYPVEFELRVIYSLTEGLELSKELGELLSARGVALETVRTLPSSSQSYGRLACLVRFLDKASLYDTYQAIGTLSGVKTVL